MRAFVLQDWITIRGGTTITTIIQNEPSWAQLDAFQDVIFWTQVAEVTTGAGTISINYDTAPIKDETLFTAMATQGVSSASLTPTLNKILMASATTPVSKWVRWRITQSGTSSAWDMTFRILLVANQQVVFMNQSQ